MKTLHFKCPFCNCIPIVEMPSGNWDRNGCVHTKGRSIQGSGGIQEDDRVEMVLPSRVR